MEFYKTDEFSSYAHEGVWYESECDTPVGFDYIEVFTITMDELEEDVYEFTFFDNNDPKDSWFARVRVIHDGSISVYDADTDEYMGYVPINSNMSERAKEEQYLLGIYDVIEAWFHDVEIFGVNR